MKAKTERNHVHVAILHMGSIRWELSATVNAMLLNHRAGHRVSFRYYGDDYFSRPIPSSRNRIVRDAPKDADFILMLDADVVPPTNILEIAGFDLDIVASPSPIWRGGEDGDPVITGAVPLDGTEVVSVGEDKLLECRYVQGGAYCIAKRVFRHPEMRGAFADGFDEDGVVTDTEDYVYCRKARALGFRVWAALGYPLGHVKSVNLVSVHDAIQGRVG